MENGSIELNPERVELVIQYSTLSGLLYSLIFSTGCTRGYSNSSLSGLTKRH